MTTGNTQSTSSSPNGQPSLATTGNPNPDPTQSSTQKTSTTQQQTNEPDPSLATTGTGDEGGAPAKYDLKIPEGYTISPENMKEVDSLFRGMDLSNEQGQKLVDFYEAKTKEALEAPVKLWLDQQTKWVDEVKADPVIGGTNLKTTLNRIAKYIDAMPNAAEFRKQLTYTGAGNNPAIIRGLDFFAKQFTESGRYQSGGTSTNTGKVATKPGAKALYPTLPSVHDGA